MQEKKEEQFDVCIQLVKYSFDDEEKKNIANRLAESVKKLNEIKKEKKEVTSNFNEKIDAESVEINTLAQKIRDGFELRNVECKIIKDYDDKKIIYKRLDNNEIVKTKEMDDNELQMNLGE